MTFVNFGGQRVHLSMGGPDRVIIDENGQRHKFEMHPYCGPILLNADGDPAKRQPSAKASFWNVTTWWIQQGGNIDANGLCVWKKPNEPKLHHLGGRHYKVINDTGEKT